MTHHLDSLRFKIENRPSETGLRAVVVGTGGYAEARVQAVEEAPGVRLVGRAPERLELFGAGTPGGGDDLHRLFERADVAFVAVPPGGRFRVAEAAVKRGTHVFLEWPPAVSVREAEGLVELAEEAGVEAGVSRPLRFHPLFGALPEGWRADLVTLRETAAAAPRWPDRLADAVDLCCALAQTSGVQRIGAQAVRSGGRIEAAAFGLRFHTGAYAQAELRGAFDEASAKRCLYVAGPGFEAEADLAGHSARVCFFSSPKAAQWTGEARPARPAAVQAETHAFLDAVGAGRPAPVSALDALHTLRLAERLTKKLR